MYIYTSPESASQTLDQHLLVEAGSHFQLGGPNDMLGPCLNSQASGQKSTTEPRSVSLPVSKTDILAITLLLGISKGFKELIFLSGVVYLSMNAQVWKKKWLISSHFWQLPHTAKSTFASIPNGSKKFLLFVKLQWERKSIAIVLVGEKGFLLNNSLSEKRLSVHRSVGLWSGLVI